MALTLESVYLTDRENVNLVSVRVEIGKAAHRVAAGVFRLNDPSYLATMRDAGEDARATLQADRFSFERKGVNVWRLRTKNGNVALHFLREGLSVIGLWEGFAFRRDCRGN
ncbi:MAG TPA: hypothetical protein PKM57_09295 [Kiritimatiellia bacterium]|nr:hypothetical protein [Kiritimatiellia bacterium]HPS07843.1 hypothetical protein [Kiritimatiellia bacterium]